MPNAILDPTGRADRTQAPAVKGAGLNLAPRPGDLRGATVGLLVNTKQNAALFLGEVGKLLVERHGAAGVMARTKTAFALPASEELLKEMTTECDVVVTGIGDCGSCSASAVTDGVALESRGTPAAVICSDAFRGSADAIAGLRGAPGYRYVTTPHPVAVLTPDQVRERAVTVLPEVVSMLVDEAARATGTTDAADAAGAAGVDRGAA
ncbi:MAG: UGSC family (seleno)protein [Micromonosporaceae bacterium]